MARSLNLTVSSPPQSWTEPLTLSEIKRYLQIEPTSPPDDTDDDLLTAMIPAARGVFEIERGYDLAQKQYDLTLDCFDEHWEIELRDRVSSVDLFRYRDSSGAYTTLVEDTDYILDTSKRPGIVTPMYNHSWPSATLWPLSAILIRFTCGPAPADLFWVEDGEAVKTGMKALIKSWYLGEDPENEKGLPWSSVALARYGSIPRVM